MNSKSATYASLGVLALVAVWYLLATRSLLGGGSPGPTDPGYFPRMLGYALLLACLLSFITTRRQPGRRLEVANLRTIVAVLFVTSCMVAAWAVVGAFYLLAFVFLVALFTLLRPERSLRGILVDLPTAVAVTAVLYVLFDVVMAVRL